MIRALVSFIIVAVTAIWQLQPSAPLLDRYPNSTVVFKKYYPGNEILGMANDKSWHIVSISDDSLEKINFWYDQKFIGATSTKNQSDTHCIRRAWQEKNKKITTIALCDHGSYRTILSVIQK